MVCLPYTSAVPVLACIGILSCGQPPNRHAAVPRVATPSRASSICLSVFFDVGSLPCALGSISLTVFPSGLMTALPTVGSYSVPPLEMAA